jgi:hypothetical protein
MYESDVLYFDRYVRRMKQGVVNEAVVNCPLDARSMLVCQFNTGLNLNPEIINARHRIFNLIGRDANAGAFSRELKFAKVLSCVKSGAGTKRCQEQLRRSHPFIKATILGRLVAGYCVLTRFDFELNRPEMFDDDFHGILRVVKLCRFLSAQRGIQM